MCAILHHNTIMDQVQDNRNTIRYELTGMLAHNWLCSQQFATESLLT